MKHLRLVAASALLFLHCGSDDAAKDKSSSRGGAAGDDSPDASAGEGGRSGLPGGGRNSAGAAGRNATGTGGRRPGAGGTPTVIDGPMTYPDAFDPSDSPPKIGEQGCGFAKAAFCDTFGGASTVRGRAGELDSIFWSGGRMHGELSAKHAVSVGMAVIPQCRPDVSDHVWPDGDTLICDPTFDIKSGHVLVGEAAQYYGQNGYRIRQPFDFGGRTGTISFDATAFPLGPLFGWVSVAVSEDPISMPGYSIENNNEGSIIPKNAFEVHFANAGDDGIGIYNVQVFDDFKDTVYTPDGSPSATYKKGKLNHFEVLVTQEQIEVKISPYSDDGLSFGAPTVDYKVAVNLPFSRGYVQLSVHNHATLKYTQPDSAGAGFGIVDATVAQLDNVGFDGPVITTWREYEVPDSLVKFNEAGVWPLPDPYNPENLGYDIGYFIGDAADAPKQKLHFKGVDAKNVASAKIGLSAWLDWISPGIAPGEYVVMARLNGKAWRERKLLPEEADLFTKGPITVDPNGVSPGKPGTQGRLGLTIDVPVEDLVDGDNTVEFVTSHVPTSYPPIVANIDLILTTK